MFGDDLNLYRSPERLRKYKVRKDEVSRLLIHRYLLTTPSSRQVLSL